MINLCVNKTLISTGLKKGYYKQYTSTENLILSADISPFAKLIYSTEIGNLRMNSEFFNMDIAHDIIHRYTILRYVETVLILVLFQNKACVTFGMKVFRIEA